MAKMISTKLTKEEKKEMKAEMAFDAPEYPWGMRIRVEKHLLEGLGFSGDLPKAGTKIPMCIVLEVDETWDRETKNHDDKGFGGVITNIGVDTDDDKPATASVMYGKGE